MISKQEIQTDGAAVQVGPSDSNVAPSASTLPPPTAAAERTTADYLASGDRTAGLMGTAWKACVVLAVLVLAAWAAGLLPGAVRLF